MKRMLIGAAVVVVALLGVGLFLGACVFAAPTYRGPPSDHFDGDVFFDGKQPQGPLDLLRWTTTRDPGPWPEHVDGAPGEKPAARVDGGALRATFVGHATMLVQLDGLNVLTDPIWSDRASPVSWAGPRRVQDPGLRFEDLPKIDVVLVSHNHYDHCDVATLKRLSDRDRPRIFVGLGVDRMLADAGIKNVRAVDWWQSEQVGALTVHSVPNQHFSARGIGDRDGTLWTAYVVQGPAAGRFYFAGDTGYGPHFRQVGEKFPGLRLALLPIGAYAPRWFMGGVHTDPAQALQAQRDLGAKTAVGIHFATFPLADDGYDEPVALLRDALARAPDPKPDFRVPAFGAAIDVP
jgi:L-ascorbate metabolism protein UlaG (beta-lactamase superfamily)